MIRGGNHFGKWCGATKRGRMERNDNKNLISGVIACINIQHAIGQRYVWSTPLTSCTEGVISLPSDLYSLDSEHFCHLWLFFEFSVLGRAEASAYLLVTTSKASVKGKDFNCWLVLLLLSSSSWFAGIDYLHLLLLLLLSLFWISWYWPFSVVDLGFLLIAAAPTLLLYNWATETASREEELKMLFREEELKRPNVL